ncbi:sugar transferase [Candidatus Wolfebacteria bacterium RIFCSPLOWO2_01_FULL_45_19]|uniref:Sugar transferase n=1 Tax=Candidatus Wolfebacteria bacterium RIFCSPLOWO2_01_FULL_45_19 TaxID=1802557 RepID=A0A1F8DRA6_9BACT|nr:MAG: sugar transferase [Candidatus Wolfebacteria bacterium RIFCSPLOWO2_01_FULL_45_19]
MTKRWLDLFFSIFGVIILSPFLLLFAALIKIASPGPVFYRGVRAGKIFKPFRIFKFRTMVMGAEEIGGPSTAEDDPRVTKIGKFLRRFKLDELPQLFNVIKGEMSLVGPRPEVLEYAELYRGKPEEIVYSIKPGMSDYASLWDINEGEILKGAKSTEETERIYLEKIRPEKVRLQMKYVREKSLITDIKIILLTIKKIVI